jgi:hypothetical protein
MNKAKSYVSARTGILLFILFLPLVVIILVKEYNKAEYLESNFIRSPLKMAAVSIDDNSYDVLDGMRLKRYSPIKFVRTSVNSCFLEFDKAWYGTAEFILPEILVSDQVVVRLGELATNDARVFRPSEVRVENVAYHESVINIASLSSRMFRINLPRRMLPNKKRLPFGLSGVLPFRYIEIVEGCDNFIASNVSQLALTYPFSEEGSKFESNNEVLNEVYSLAKHTIEATSFAGVYVDGFREIKPYEADAYINQLGHYAVDSDYLLARHTQNYLLSNGTWPTEWAMHSVFMAYQDYMQTGDKEFLLSHYEKLKARTLLELANDDYLISSSNQTLEFRNSAGIAAASLADVIDWPFGERDGYTTEAIGLKDYSFYSAMIAFKEVRLKLVKLAGFEGASALYALDIANIKRKLRVFPSVNTVVNAFHYASLNKMAFIAGVLGKTDEARLFSDRANNVKKSIKDLLFDKNKGLYIDAPGATHASKQANVFALRFGLVPPQYVDNVLDFIIENKAGSVYLYQYVLEALFENDRSSAAVDILTSKTDRGWYNMIHGMGSSMTTESWNFNINPGMDLNHAWGTAPVNIIPRYLAGIRPMESRFSRFLVSPSDTEMNSYNAVVPTLEGKIELSMRRENTSVTYMLGFTDAKVADVYLLKPNCEQFKVTHNNTNISTASIKVSNRVALIGLRAGSHEIRLECVALRKVER